MVPAADGRYASQAAYDAAMHDAAGLSRAQFQGLVQEVRATLGGMELKIDGTVMAKMVRRYDAQRSGYWRR